MLGPLGVEEPSTHRSSTRGRPQEFDLVTDDFDLNWRVSPVSSTVPPWTPNDTGVGDLRRRDASAGVAG